MSRPVQQRGVTQADIDRFQRMYRDYLATRGLRGAEEQMEEERRARQIEPPPLPEEPTKAEPSLLQDLKRSIPFWATIEEARKGNIPGAIAAGGPFPAWPLAAALFRTIGRYGREIAAPVAAAQMAIPEWIQSLPHPLNPLLLTSAAERYLGGATQEEIRQRKQGARAAMGSFISGKISPEETRQRLKELQEDRPMVGQILSELTSPLGIAEAFLPVTKLRVASRATVPIVAIADIAKKSRLRDRISSLEGLLKQRFREPTMAPSPAAVPVTPGVPVVSAEDAQRIAQLRLGIDAVPGIRVGSIGYDAVGATLSPKAKGMQGIEPKRQPTKADQLDNIANAEDEVRAAKEGVDDAIREGDLVEPEDLARAKEALKYARADLREAKKPIDFAGHAEHVDEYEKFLARHKANRQGMIKELAELEAKQAIPIAPSAAAPVKPPITGKPLASFASPTQKRQWREELNDLKQQLSELETRVIKLSTPNEIVSMVNNPDTANRLNKIPLVRSIIGQYNKNAIMDPGNPVHRFAAAQGVLAEQSNDAAMTMYNLILAKGEPNKLFQLGTDYRSLAPGLEGKTLNEIAQFPELYEKALTPQMKAWLDNFELVTSDIVKYLKSEGIIAEDVAWAVKGRYFPNFWRMLDDIELAYKGTPGSLGGKAGFENSRFYEDASDALLAGYKPGDPNEAIGLLYRSMYKRVADKKLIDVIKPYGNTIRSRMSEGTVQYARAIQHKRAGLKHAERIINSFRFQAIRGPKARVQLQGLAAAEREAPEIMESFWKATPLVGKEKTAAIRAIKADMKILLVNIQKRARAAKEALAEARVAAGIRRDLGEVQFPMTGLSGKIFSPDEMVKNIFPEATVRDLKTLPRKQVEELTKVMKPQIRGFLDRTADINSFLRTIRAGLDLGVHFIHGTPVLLTNPSAWAKATRVSLEALRDPTAIAQLIDDHFDTVRKLIKYNQLHGAGSEYVEGLGKGGLLHKMLGGAGKVVPGERGQRVIKKMAGTTEAIEREFNGMLIASKIYLWEAMESSAMRHAGEAGLQDLAAHISKLTGTISMANLGMSPTLRKLLGSMVLFAPRYRLASYGLMADAFRGGLRGSLAREAFGKMLAGGLLFYSAVAARLGQEPNLDPRSGKFLTIKVGDANIGLGTAFVSTSRFIAKSLVKIQEDPGHFMSFDPDENPAIRFAWGQSSPTTSIVGGIWRGRNYMGEPTTASIPDFLDNVVKENLMPFWAQGLAEYPRAGWAGSTAEFGGLRAFPTSLWERAAELGDQYANEEYDKGWADLNRLEKDTLLEAYPDLQADFDEANQLWRDRGMADEFTEYRDFINDFKNDTYIPAIEEDLLALVTGEISARTFRKRYQDIGHALGRYYEQVENMFPEVVEVLNEETQNPDAKAEDIAYSEYLRTVVNGEFETEGGEYDFARRDIANDAFRMKWGEAYWAYIQERREMSRDAPELIKEMMAGRDQWRAYWEAGEHILQSIGQESLILEWRRYLKARAFERDEIEKDRYIFKQIYTAQAKARNLMRQRSPELDAFLFRWQYTDSLKPANRGREQELTSYG